MSEKNVSVYEATVVAVDPKERETKKGNKYHFVTVIFRNEAERVMCFNGEPLPSIGDVLPVVFYKRYNAETKSSYWTFGVQW